MAELAGILLESLSSQPNTAENKEQLRKLLIQLRQRHPKIFSDASLWAINKSDEDRRLQIEELILSLSVVSTVIVRIEYLLMLLNLDKLGLYVIEWEGGQNCRPYNRICRLGSEYTCGGGAELIRRGQR